MRISENKTNASTINEFKELLEKAKIEHSETITGQTEKTLKEKGITDVPPQLVDLVRQRSIERIDSLIETRSKSVPITKKVDRNCWSP